jgi:hypothetical protein
MLSSIHPLGEAGRRQRWWLTVTAHVVGSVLGGASAGLVLGGAGAVAAWAGLGWAWRLGIAAVVAAGAALVDLRGWPRWLWRPRRQVNEDWLGRYRGWVYGGGFGFQLGSGVTTIVTAATVYVVGALALAAGSWWWGLVIGAVFGLARGATVLWGREIVDADRLVQFHRRLQERAVLGRSAAVGADVAVAVVALAGMVSVIRGMG